ncbi:MAG: hypothetical protein BWZ02_03280 [Lentisphaerae bacterium ADurb.BinA184]|nr:MAG: hypothetical protein BWZ02_03280 [Lentisphaerae bacterium ADurb.BinA184]
MCWCGCAPAAGLVIEVRTGPDLPPARLAWVRERFVQGLDVSAAGQPCEWCVFGARFVSPAGFVYRASALNLGDLSLEFADPAGRRLRLRQVYPADLALARRSLADWLEDSRLRGTLRMVPDGPAEARTLAAGLEGLTRSGRLRLALPPLTRRRFADVAAVQSRRNRLFYAGLDSRGRASPDVAVVETALAAMAGGGPGAGAEER